jgi:hypothetical protein
MVVRSARLFFEKLLAGDLHMNLRCTMMAKAMYLSREGGHGLPRIMICIKVGS